MPGFVDPYLLRLVTRPELEIDCLVVWKDTEDFRAARQRLSEDLEVVNTFLNGAILHLRGRPEPIRSLTMDDAAAIVHATFPPIIV
jgi:hypothetical protein